MRETGNMRVLAMGLGEAEARALEGLLPGASVESLEVAGLSRAGLSQVLEGAGCVVASPASVGTGELMRVVWELQVLLDCRGSAPVLALTAGLTEEQALLAAGSCIELREVDLDDPEGARMALAGLL